MGPTAQLPPRARGASARMADCCNGRASLAYGGTARGAAPRGPRQLRAMSSGAARTRRGFHGHVRRALAEESEKAVAPVAEEEERPAPALLTASLKRGEPCAINHEGEAEEALAAAARRDDGGADAWRWEDSGYLKQTLNARVYDVAKETELQEAKSLSQQLGNAVFLKREDMQAVFSFKLRGAFNRMAQLSPDELARGVICSSAGNHAQGVALSGRRLGCRAIICMPLITPEIKIEAVKRLGGEVELVGENYDACQAYAIAKAEEEGLTYIHPFDDPYVIAGQGTVGVEILRQCSGALLDSSTGEGAGKDLHAIFVPVGGGGLLAGISSFVKQVRPDVKVYGVEPLGASCMAEALMRGEVW